MTNDIERRTSFIRLDRRLGDALSRNKDMILSAMPAVLDQFYEHLGTEPEVWRLFRSPEHIKHAKEMQLQHWKIILDARFDSQYVDSVTRIGEVHNKLGIEPKWYIGGYTFLVSGLHAWLMKPGSGFRISPRWLKERSVLIEAITKAAMLDMDYAISVYISAGQRDRRTSLNELAEIFRSSIGSVSVAIDDAATRLKSSAGELIDGAQSTETDAVGANRSASQAAENVSTVAAASEELASSVSEIGRQVLQSHQISEEAAANSARAIETIRSLTIASDRVGEIVSLISDIAAKTNLLALNATIEAARAGSAGKGFAVVASEVKGLAEQTARATAEISSQVEEIQSVTASSSGAIESVHGTIERLNEISAIISAAVEQQESATQEISSNIQAAAGGAGEASRALIGIGKSVNKALDDARKVDQETGDLSIQAQQLKQVSGEFLEKIAGM